MVLAGLGIAIMVARSSVGALSAPGHARHGRSGLASPARRGSRGSRRSSVKETGMSNGAFGADKFGLDGLDAVHWNLLEPQLYELAIAAGQARLAARGALRADTGVHTGRSPKD